MKNDIVEKLTVRMDIVSNRLYLLGKDIIGVSDVTIWFGQQITGVPEDGLNTVEKGVAALEKYVDELEKAADNIPYLKSIK